jgi:hypothetical protein
VAAQIITPSIPVEQRFGFRRRVLKSGIIAFNDHHSTIACGVRDLTATGARLRVDGSISAPDTFDLIIKLDGLEAHCVVAWRKDGEIGVRFTVPPRISPPKRAQVVNALVPPRVSLRRKVTE